MHDANLDNGTLHLVANKDKQVNNQHIVRLNPSYNKMLLINSSQLRLKYCKKKLHKVLPHERDLASDHHISCSASIEESDGEPILFTAIA